MTTRNDFDEVRVTEAAEYIRKKLNELFEPGNVLKDCPAYKNGLTNAETEVAIIRALGLMVIDGTGRMFRFQSDVEEYDD